MSKVFKRFTGFTLAEVLITLGIIGIVAAITIPTLMNNIQEAQYKTAYRKAFSIAAQAWMAAAANNEIESRAAWNEATSKVNNFNTFKSYFKVAKDCNNSNNSDCWANGEKSWGNYPDSNALAFVDNSGMCWSLVSNLTGFGADILVDTNGFKQPNQYGLDRFIFEPVPAAFQVPAVFNWAVVQPQLIGFPAKISPSYTGDTGYDVSVCPSGAKHPCYYNSWLYN